MSTVQRQRVSGIDAWGHGHSWVIEWKPLRAKGNDAGLDNIGMTPIIWEDECPVGVRHDNMGGVELWAPSITLRGDVFTPHRVHGAHDLSAGCWRVVDELEQGQWDVAKVAEHLGLSVSSVRSYRARGRMPAEDGTIGNSPWWWEDTITEWEQERPGQGVGGGRPRRSPGE